MSTFKETIDKIADYMDNSEVVKMKGAIYALAFSEASQIYNINTTDFIERAISCAIDSNQRLNGFAGGIIQDAASEIRLEIKSWR